MLDVGFVGWRGMVGSVLLERMREEGDFAGLASTFYSTSSPGGPGPADLGFETGRLGDAYEVAALARHEVIVTCQGGDYTKAVHPRLRAAGWNGYWIDAASALRMEPGTVLALDPVNADVVAEGLAGGRRDFCGANCTVSILLMAFAGLFRAGLVEWMTSMTYQAASGAGAAQMRELAAQMAAIGEAVQGPLADPATTALAVDRSVRKVLAGDGFPTDRFGAPLAASLLPWIDRPVGGGESREERKGFEEGNKILGNDTPVPIDGLCVRVGSMRCHAHAVTAKLREDRPVDEIEALVAGAHDWVRVVENTPEATLAGLTPAAVSGRLEIAVGRIRKLRMGGEYLAAFSVGDQLLWGAAEPLRRMLGILRSHLAEVRTPSAAEAA